MEHSFKTKVAFTPALMPRGVARSACRVVFTATFRTIGMLIIGCIAYWREGGDGSAQRGRSVIYDSLVLCLCNYISREA